MRWRAAAVAVLLAACATTVEPPPATTGRPADFPDASYQGLRSGGAPVYRVDPARSRVVVVVRRGGTLAQFGHDHVVASHDVGGFVAPSAGRADLYVPLDALVVDPPALRLETGLDTRPSDADIAATRRNMLEKVLETGRFPYATVAVTPPSGEPSQPHEVALTLHGVTRAVEVALDVRSAGDEVVATGSFAIDQSQFGIVPFSILGGAIAVKDRLDITFQIVASRAR
jgi:polyisoprenoid-binding protein YceI